MSVALLQHILEARSEADTRDQLTQLFRKFNENGAQFMKCDGLDTKQYEALIEYLLVEV
jgi:hypothetical protein